MSTPAVLADACPVCPPGVPDAAFPVSPPETVKGGTLAQYECGTCGTGWETWFTADGWPAGRLIAPVSPAQAERNRDELEQELKRERNAA
jgi:hypothetical protein